MKAVRNSFSSLLLAAALQGCAQAPPQLASPATLEAVVPAIASHFSACNLDLLMTTYAPSIEFVSPSTPKPLIGLQAVREHLAGACAATFRPVMKVEAQRVRMLSSESAVVTGTYTIGGYAGEHPRTAAVMYAQTSCPFRRLALMIAAVEERGNSYVGRSCGSHDRVLAGIRRCME